MHKSLKWILLGCMMILLISGHAFAKEDGEKQGQENSWRYENGIWLEAYNTSGITEEEDEQEPDFIPWTYTEGHYINSEGEPIPNVVARGIDVSGWQSVIDWEQVITDDVSFAILRCGYSFDGIDSQWERNAKECERLGIPYGTYLYSYAESPEESKKEAEHVLNLIKDKNMDFPVYYDMEDDIVRYIYTDEPVIDEETGEPIIDEETGEVVTEPVRGRQRTGKELAEMAKAFIDTIEAAGYNATIYTNLDWSYNVLTDAYFDQFTDRWIAQYYKECTYKESYAMWQCSGSGQIKGISTPVDINMLFTVEYNQRYMIRNYVTRLYNNVLGRVPDVEGLNAWINVLIRGNATGSEVARDFFFSKEFLDKNVSNEEFVEILYNTCMDRPSDPAGKDAWVERLEQGFSRLYVLRGFVKSAEFEEICAGYGILSGDITLTEYRDLNDGATEYVGRCYELFLGRKPDAQGLNDWTKVILEDSDNARTLPEGFILSEEFLNKGISDEDFVKICYKAILDREADASGLEAWVARLEAGDSRKDVCYGFTQSEEFSQLLKSYGL